MHRVMTMEEAVKLEIRNAKRRARPREDSIQKAVVKILRAHPGVALVWHTPNERQSEKQRRYLYSMGVQNGIPDLMMILKNGTHIAIELKRPGEKPSAIQLEILKILKNSGWKTGVCRSVDEVLEVVHG